MHGINAELVTEFAKDKVWENNTEVFKNQAYLFGKQSYRISRCKDKVDVIVTDSPLPLSIFYNNDPSLTENFNKSVMDVFNSYNNLNYLLLRTKPYNPIGRHQSEEESDALKEPMVKMLKDRNIQYKEVDGDIHCYDQIVEDVVNIMKKQQEVALISGVSSIKVEPIWNNWFCKHVYDNGSVTVRDEDGKIRHVKICKKCGKQFYID